MNRISTFIKETLESSMALCHMRTRQEDGHLWTRKPSLDTKYASALVLDLPATRAVKNKFVVYEYADHIREKSYTSEQVGKYAVETAHQLLNDYAEEYGCDIGDWKSDLRKAGAYL